MNFPKISIVIPSYNQGQFLEETILSIINQRYPDLELFVVDGESNDNSVDIIKKYESQISWWISEKDKGQSHAINKGFARANGEIISWLCSDDLLTPNALETVAAHFSSAGENIGLVHGGAVIFERGKIKATTFNYQVPNKEAYLSGMVFPQPAAFFRRSFLDKVGFLNESFHYGMDYDLFLRLSLICDFLPVKEVIARYRLHGESKSVAQGNRFINDWKRSFVNLCKNLSWAEELRFIKSCGLYVKELDFEQKFCFPIEASTILNINSKKVLCYHLGHVLKDLYWTGKIDSASRLKKQMQDSFPSDWFKEDDRLIAVFKKLELPGSVLKSLKKIKRYFNK